jgi:hypothetical protein
MPEANKIIDILQSERSFGRVIREIQDYFLYSEIAHWFATVRSEWYRVVHDIVPTNDRMHKIGLMDTDLYTTC